MSQCLSVSVCRLSLRQVHGRPALDPKVRTGLWRLLRGTAICTPHIILYLSTRQPKTFGCPGHARRGVFKLKAKITKVTRTKISRGYTLQFSLQGCVSPLPYPRCAVHLFAGMLARPDPAFDLLVFVCLSQRLCVCVSSSLYGCVSLFVYGSLCICRSLFLSLPVSMYISI